MSELPIPLARPVIGEREVELVTQVLESGVLSLGEMAPLFERQFASFLGARHALAVSSGTAALHLGIRALGVGPGDEVITSPFSFVASANCIVYEGAKPVFVDVDRLTLNIDPVAIEAAITRRTKAILPVHIFGYPADMQAIESIANRHNLAILEDACEALGAKHRDGLYVGARGHLTGFGFYPNKQLTTGEGGMIACADQEIAARLASERNQGRATDMQKVEHERLGFNYRLDELSCALGVAQLERLEKTLAARAQVAGWYSDRLAGIEGLGLPCSDRDGDRRSWFVYVVRLPNRADRDVVINELAAAGIASKAYLPAIHLQPYYRQSFGFRGGEFPVCEEMADHSLAMPFYPGLQEAGVERVCDRLRDALEVARMAPA